MEHQSSKRHLRAYRNDSQQDPYGTVGHPTRCTGVNIVFAAGHWVVQRLYTFNISPPHNRKPSKRVSIQHERRSKMIGTSCVGIFTKRRPFCRALFKWSSCELFNSNRKWKRISLAHGLPRRSPFLSSPLWNELTRFTIYKIPTFFGPPGGPPQN